MQKSLCLQELTPFLFSYIRNLTQKQRQLMEEFAKEERGEDDDKEEAAAASA